MLSVLFGSGWRLHRLWYNWFW